MEFLSWLRSLNSLFQEWANRKVNSDDISYSECNTAAVADASATIFLGSASHRDSLHSCETLVDLYAFTCGQSQGEETNKIQHPKCTGAIPRGELSPTGKKIRNIDIVQKQNCSRWFRTCIMPRHRAF